ncbi:MAG: hypothetical protein FD165_2299 [Gammaproteobacteria bacterium]|nr:MAG: hypothetical protein FD165_2299 [Gammaproteobacteria bacterium]TND02625.1 MAG: hypothetical protein FD120_2086 [Gammaproteobacteria bacterium]
MQNLFYALPAILAAIVLVRFAMLAIRSRHGTPPGLKDGMLAACPASPNCVCSEPLSESRAISPVTWSGHSGDAWRRFSEAVTEAGGEIQVDGDGYLWATFRTPVFRFVDDFEARLDAASNVIHVRSASRVGYSDFGTNRRRVEDLRRRFESRAGDV